MSLIVLKLDHPFNQHNGDDDALQSIESDTLEKLKLDFAILPSQVMFSLKVNIVLICE